ncbi:hypothetical protein, partial [Algiphilus sp.]|uniref:hypothetical protein n=1 Tax=Algiphilus sp. TaxID=1872431 RepID=UPI0025B8B35C
MNINSQLTNSSTLLPDVQVDRYQKQSKNGQVDGATTSSPGSEGVASQATRESVDQVRLSPAARQAYEVSTLPADAPKAMAGEIAAGKDDGDGGGDSMQVALPGEEVAPTDGSIAAYEKQAVAGEENSVDGTGQSEDNARSEDADSLTLSADAQQQVVELAQR